MIKQGLIQDANASVGLSDQPKCTSTAAEAFLFHGAHSTDPPGPIAPMASASHAQSAISAFGCDPPSWADYMPDQHAPLYRPRQSTETPPSEPYRPSPRPCTVGAHFPHVPRSPWGPPGRQASERPPPPDMRGESPASHIRHSVRAFHYYRLAPRGAYRSMDAQPHSVAHSGRN